MQVELNRTMETEIQNTFLSSIRAKPHLLHYDKNKERKLSSSTPVLYGRNDLQRKPHKMPYMH